MSRTRKFFYNSLSTIVLQFVTMIVGLILPRIMLKYYGSEINGLVTSITQFISYFNLVEAGLASAAIFSLYKPLAENNCNSINKIVSTTKKYYYISGTIFTVLVVLLAIIYPLLMKTTILTFNEIFILIIIIGGSGFLDFFTLAKYRVILTADQKLYVVSIASIIYYTFNTAIIVLLAKLGAGIIITRFIALSAIVIRSLILYLYVKKHYIYLDYNKKSEKKLISKRWDALYLQILGSIQNGAPIIILTIFTNLLEVSIYSIYNMVLQGINGILSIFINGLSSSFGEIIAKGETKTLQKVSQEFEYIYYNLITLVYSISFVLIMPFISIYTKNITDSNYYFPILGLLFVLNGLLYNIKTPQGMLVISAGLYKETKVPTTIQGLIVVILGIILTPKLGIIGMLVASICSNLYRDIELSFYIPNKLTKLSVYATIRRQLKLCLLSCVLLVIYSSIKVDISSYLEWGIYGILFCIIGFIVILLYDIVFDRTQLNKFILRIKTLVGAKK